MQDLKLMAELGATAEKFKAKFTAKKLDDRLKRLQERHSNRLRKAIDCNLQEAPIFGAIDHALEAAQDNLPNIQARMLAGMGKTNEEIVALFKDFNLGKLLEPVTEIVDGQVVAKLDSKREPLLTFNQPLFEHVFLPMVQCYCDMRAGKLFNDRDLYPRYKYAPPRMTLKDMVTADVITNRVQRMTSDMGYADDDKQSFKQMTYYGICFNMPKEAYHREEYDTKDKDKVVTKVKREGVRFVIPHPSRHFWDRSCPLYTLNSDTGVSYFGYWDIVRWETVRDNNLFWNTDKITYGGYDLFSTATWRIFQSFYPCVVTLPKVLRDLKTKSEFDRVASEQSSFLKDEDDATITHAVLFDKIVPSEWGLFDYDKPVWMRFIYANFESCIYCEVLPYTPGYVYLDRYDANKTIPAGMGLQLTPFAQLLGNFLTQHFMSVKQNLFRVNWVNTDIMPADQISWLKKQKDKVYSAVNWLMYSKKHNSFQIGDRGDQREAVTSMQNPQVNVQDVAANINLALMAVERMLGFSPQEVGAPASHEQSATEVNVANENTSVNIEFTGTGIDSAWSAKKRLLYTAFYCYGSDEVFAEVADLTPEREKALKDLGFEIEKSEDGNTHFGVKGSKAALVMDSFLSDREGVTRLNDSKVGIAMLQNLGQVAQNPILFQTIGAPQFVTLFNYVWKMIGLPEDFRLKAVNKDAAQNPQEQQQQFMQALEQAKKSIVENAVAVVDQQIKSQVVEPVTKEFMTVKGQLEQMMQQDQIQNAAIQKLMPLIELMAHTTQPQVPVVNGVPVPPQLPPGGVVQPPVLPNANPIVRPQDVAPTPV
jgi:hypothetical protein